MRTGFELTKVVDGLRRSGIDAAVITSVPNIRYSTGIIVQTHETLPMRLMMLIVPTEGPPVFLACETRQTLTCQAPDWLKDVRCYREFDKNPIQVLAEVLAERNLRSARIGIERDYLVTSFAEQLRNECPQATFLPVGPLMDQLRMIKSPHEIQQLRLAYVATVEALAEAFAQTQVGDSESQVADRIRQNLMRRGAEQIGFNIVVIEERTPWAHPPPGDRTLATGEILRVDVSAAFGHYYSDVGRTASAGQWRPDLRRAFDALAKVRQQVITHLKPSMRIGDIYTNIMNSYPRFGMPVPPIHTLLIGHGLGIEVHEPPIIEPSTETKLASGMVLNIEPDVRPNGFCMAHEDTYLVTEEGVELLAPLEVDAPLIIGD